MQYPETRYRDALNAGISGSALSLDVQTTPPTRTQGVMTIGRLAVGGGPNVEDVYYTSVAGNTVTIGIRGLSTTALTPTNIPGNQKVHQASESLEITTHHNYITNLLRKDENDTVSGNISFTGTNTFALAPLTPGLKDANGNESIDTPATASAVNQLSVQNAATGGNVILTTAGGDADIDLELQAKGSGVIILEDEAQLKTSAAPTTDPQIANKKYVDDAVSAASTTDSSRLYAPLTDALGETFSASDITNNLNLAYKSTTDGKWYKITSTTSTWYQRLGIVLDSGVANDTNKRILLKGSYTGKSFPNIQPTFSASGTGTTTNIGETTSNHLAAIRVSNNGNAQCGITAVTLSLRQQGAPTSALGVSIVLENSVEPFAAARVPAAYPPATLTNPTCGAVIATGTIAQALFSGTYTNLTCTLGSTAKIPAGVNFYIVLQKLSAVSGANYYQVQSSGALQVCNNTNTWSGTAGTGNYTLTVNSTSPIGYFVKGYTGTNGSFGVECIDGTNGNNTAWTRPIGRVTSATTFYFDPEFNAKKTVFQAGQQTTEASSTLRTFSVGFCPSQVDFSIGAGLAATTDVSIFSLGTIRGDAPQVGGQLGPGAVSGVGQNSSIIGFNYRDTGTLAVPFNQGQNGGCGGVAAAAGAAGTQNILNCLRLEDGFYTYTTYPGGANNITVGAAGATDQYHVIQAQAFSV